MKLPFENVFSEVKNIGPGVDVTVSTQNGITSLPDRGVWLEADDVITIQNLTLYKDVTQSVWVKPHGEGSICANQPDTLRLRRRLQQDQGAIIQNYNQLIFEI